MENTMKRTLGRSGIEITSMGMGCWAIGGPLKAAQMDEVDLILASMREVE